MCLYCVEALYYVNIPVRGTVGIDQAGLLFDDDDVRSHSSSNDVYHSLHIVRFCMYVRLCLCCVYIHLCSLTLLQQEQSTLPPLLFVKVPLTTC